MFRCCPSRRPRVCQFDLNVLDGPISLTSDLVWSSGSWQLAVGSWQFSNFRFAGNLLLRLPLNNPLIHRPQEQG
jgi:hypothetical protein